MSPPGAQARGPVPPPPAQESLQRLKTAACLWQAVGWGLFAVACQVLRESLLRH